MRRIVSSLSFFSLAVLFLAALSPSALAAEYSYARIVRLSFVSGDVQINRGGNSSWEQAIANMPIEQGFTIGTNDGRAEVEFEDGATIWIAENTLVQFTELALSDGGRISHLTIAQGTLTASASLKSGDSFTLTAGQVQASVAKRAMFRMDAFRDGASISVLSGSVEANSPAGAKLVPKGETFAFSTKAPDLAALRQNPKPDSWDSWVNNRQRYGQSAAAQSPYFSNSSFTYGMGDLSAYGNWGYFPGYGYGWQPFGMGSCWMPFANGMWDSYPGLGWTWVSYEPWGWVPYHFGTWNFSPAYGWMWMPGDMNSWNPAPVDWYDAGNDIAWTAEESYSGSSLVYLPRPGGGCGGWNGGLVSGSILTSGSTGRGVKGSSVKPGPGGKRPIPPHFLLTAGKRIGGIGQEVRLLTTGGAAGSVEAMPAPPLANGKIGGLSENASEVNSAQNSRVFVTTAANLNQLRANMRVSANGSTATLMRIPSAPAISAMPTTSPIRNAGLMPSAMPHAPSPMHFSRGIPSFEAAGGTGRGTFHGGTPSFSAPRSTPSSPAPPSHPPASSGKPH